MWMLIVFLQNRNNPILPRLPLNIYGITDCSEEALKMMNELPGDNASSFDLLQEFFELYGYQLEGKWINVRKGKMKDIRKMDANMR